MCGFVGGTIPRDARLDLALDQLRFRGPDDRQVDAADGVSLGFARLAIVDTRAIANQPMTAEAGMVRIVFNGEIYGFDRLRTELESWGFSFATRSDTEVLLRAYLHWGDDFIDRVDGMFAICIHDRRTQELKLFRDRCGIKPLYYHWDGKVFCFASELKAIRSLIGSERLQVDHTALFDFLTYRYVPAPKSLYRNVFKLLPAHQLTFRIRSQQLIGPRAYWALPTESDRNAKLKTEDAVGQTRELIRVSVRDQLVADVPVGCFLSGGVDSSAVVATATRLAANVKTFTIGFEDDKHSELAFARLVAQQLETCHHEEIFSSQSDFFTPEQMADWFDEPLADTSAYPTYLVSRVARQRVIVALSGDGGDELFGGYRWYSRFQRLRRLTGIGPESLAAWFGGMRRNGTPRTLRRRFNTLGQIACSDEFALYTLLMAGLPHEDKQWFADAWEIPRDYDSYWKFRQHWRNDLPLWTRMQYLDFHTFLPDDILTKVDRTSMANSLEVRVPLLSRDLVEFAFTLPEKLRLPGCRPKGLLKAAFHADLPVEIINRSKQGFSLPFKLRQAPFLATPDSFLQNVFSSLLPFPATSDTVAGAGCCAQDGTRNGSP